MSSCTVSSRSSKRPAIAGKPDGAPPGAHPTFEAVAPGSLRCGPGVFFAPRWYEMGRKGVDTHRQAI